MKGLACSKCIDLRLLPQRDLDPVSCRCGNVTAWWTNGEIGEAVFTADFPDLAQGVGFNNHFLTPALRQTGLDSTEAWQALHAAACEAPGYLFDKTRRACWVAFFKPNTVAAVTWATEDQRAEVGLLPYPDGHPHAGT